MVYTPVSVRSAEGINIWDAPGALLMVTRLDTGMPSFSQVTSGHGEALI